MTDILRIMLTPKQARLIKKAARLVSQDVSTWARNTLLDAIANHKKRSCDGAD